MQKCLRKLGIRLARCNLNYAHVVVRKCPRVPLSWVARFLHFVVRKCSIRTKETSFTSITIGETDAFLHSINPSQSKQQPTEMHSTVQRPRLVWWMEVRVIQAPLNRSRAIVECKFSCTSLPFCRPATIHKDVRSTTKVQGEKDWRLKMLLLLWTFTQS